MSFAQLRCRRCGTASSELLAWRCGCGAPWEIDDASRDPFDRPAARRQAPTLRFHAALHLDDPDAVVSLGEGDTPITRVPWAGGEVAFKLDYLSPTGSFKDRGAAVMISKLREAGAHAVAEDSSGNAGAALAAYAATAGIACTIYVPRQTAPAKRKQIQAYGADLVEVDGSREDTAIACQQATDAVYASHNWNPFFVAGVKTIAYEIFEAYGSQLPEWIVMPVGYGSVALGMVRGLDDLVRWGRITRLPRLVLVQAESHDPVHRAFVAGADEVAPLPPSDAATQAEGIACHRPVRGAELLDAARRTQGMVVAVTEKEITQAAAGLARTGLWVEPTAAVVPAAITRLVRDDDLDPQGILGILTGHGLKGSRGSSATAM